MDQDGAYLAVTREAGQLPRAVRAVVFDLDGTLLDTERAYRAAFLDTVALFGRVLPHGAYEQLVGLPTPARRRMLPAILGEDCPTDSFIGAYYQMRAKHLADGIALKPGAPQLLAWLQARSVPTAIATSASAATAASHLDAAGLAGRFSIVVSRDEVARGKPAPDGFALAAATLGIEACDCLALEDSAHGVTAAHAAGMMVVMVPDLLAPGPDTAARCVAVVSTLRDVSLLVETAGKNDRSRFCV